MAGIRIGALCVAVLWPLACAWAENIDPDELPRNPVLLPDGTKTYHVRYLDRNWRETTPEVLQKKGLQQAEDICFESKFAGFSKDLLTLFNKGRVVCNDPHLTRYIQKLNRGDNIWICGTLRPASDGQSMEVKVEDIRRMKGDLMRAQAHYARMTERKDAKGLIQLGRDLTTLLGSNMFDFNEHDQFLELRTKCWTAALVWMEKELAPDDAAGLFAVALKWKDLLNKTYMYHQLIHKVLALDPGHGEASRIAVDEMGLVKFRGKWMDLSERSRLLDDERAHDVSDTDSRKPANDAANRSIEEARRERVALLMKFQSAIRTHDFKALEKTYRDFGDAIRTSPDPQFGLQSIHILAHAGDPYAVWPGLDVAVKTALPSVRQHAMSALAWLGSENALEVLATALQAERDPETARVAIDALLAGTGRPKLTVKAMVDGLSNPTGAVTNELVKGLNGFTGLNLADKDAWINWWTTNRNKNEAPVAERNPGGG